MSAPDDPIAILDRIANHQHTEADIVLLRQYLTDGGQIVSQKGKYAVNLGQGQDIQVGDRIYQGANAEAVREIIRSILQEFQAASPSVMSRRRLPQSLEQDSLSVNELVQQVRQKIRADIQERCGTMRVLDMTQPIGISDIYTDVNILEKITGRRRIDIAELMQGFDPDSEDFERYGLGRIAEQRVPGIDAVKRLPKLMVLGKPGAGKTTFLKYLAIQCNCGEFQAERVPIFITLKQFAEAISKLDILKFLYQSLERYEVNKYQINSLLKHGIFLFLLDGLDEVREEDSRRIINKIQDLSNQYSANHFVITCRIAAREYTFQGFTEVEVSDFDNHQIKTFAEKWFKLKDPVKSKKFIERLEKNKPIKELATSPLLLTMLCLVFEETANFPQNRSELYEEGLDVLLKKWDVKRNIERDQVYKKLSIKRKEDLLSKIAFNTFKQGDYFFKQKVVKNWIAEYIKNLVGAEADSEALQLDSEAVLKSIEAQHGILIERARGIYSFSHLTFHEYFTAKRIAASSNPKAFQYLANHITEHRWREVILLASGMFQNSNYFLQLLKTGIDKIVASDEKMQQFLMWVQLKSCSGLNQFKTVTMRAYYFDFALSAGRRNLANNLESSFHHSRALTALDRTLIAVLGRTLSLNRTFAFDNVLAAINRTFTFDLEPKMRQALQQLKDQLPYSQGSKQVIEKWWQANGQAWTRELRAVMVEHRNIGHDWQFSNYQNKLLKQYYNANLLLVECLSSDCYVSREVRQEIEDTLLLPIAEIEKRKAGLS